MFLRKKEITSSNSLYQAKIPLPRMCLLFGIESARAPQFLRPAAVPAEKKFEFLRPRPFLSAGTPVAAKIEAMFNQFSTDDLI